VTPSRRVRAERRQTMTIVYAVMVSILILVLIQYLLLMIALEDYLSGKRSVLIGTAAASAVCFAVSCRLIGYLAARRAPGP